MHKETKEQKSKKKAYIDSDQSTIDFWVYANQDLRVYDQIYTEEKYLIKEVNLVDYSLRALELMTQVAQYSDVSFIIALINQAAFREKQKDFINIICMIICQIYELFKSIILFNYYVISQSFTIEDSKYNSIQFEDKKVYISTFCK